MDITDDSKAVMSLLLGVAWLTMRITWAFLNVPRFIVPLIGAPINIVGLILGIKTLKSSKRKIAIIGIIICSFGLLITIVQAILLYLRYSFQNIVEETAQFT